MKTVAVVEAKSHFSSLLAEVARGEEIAISRHGRVIARLVPDTREQMAADVFRSFWSDDVDLVAPPDILPEPVASWD